MADDVTGADTTLPPERVDVAVIGAGQAGLAVGHYLRDSGRSFRILEADESVGAAWRKRWDSLVLFTSRRFDALPGMAFPGDPDGYPTRDETVAYLETYAESFELPIEFLSPVSSLGSLGGRVHPQCSRPVDLRRAGRRCDWTIPEPIDPSDLS